MSQYSFRLGSDYLTPTPINSGPWMLAEVLKAFHTFGSNTMGSLFTRTSYARNAIYDPTAATEFGSFCIGIDLESAARAKGHHVISGANTLGTNGIQLDLMYATAPPTTSTFNAFCQVDTLLTYSNGQIAVSA